MFHFEDRGCRRSVMPLPNKASICLTIDVAFEAFEEACQHRGRQTPKGVPDPYSLSFAEYGLRVGIWRLSELLNQFNLKGGIMTNGLAADRYPKTLAALHHAGHEIIAHGWTNDAGTSTDDIETETASVIRTTRAIENVTGYKAVGWVSPGYAGTTALRQALVSQNYLYTCDDAADDLPYIVEISGKKLVVMPRTNFGSNDLGTWFGAKQTPKAFLSSVKSQFDSILEEVKAGRTGWMELVLHAQFAGRLQCATELKEMLSYMLEQKGVWCTTRNNYAKWCLDNSDIYRS